MARRQKQEANGEALALTRKLQVEAKLSTGSADAFLAEAGYKPDGAAMAKHTAKRDLATQLYTEDRLRSLQLNTNTEVNRMFRRANKLMDASEDAMIHPDDPDRYVIASCPSDHTYKVFDPRVLDDKGNPVERLMQGNELMDAWAQALGLEIKPYKVRRTDPYKTMLDGIKSIAPYVKMLGDMAGVFKAPETHPEDVKRNLAQQARVLFQEFLDECIDREEAIARFRQFAPAAVHYIDAEVLSD